MTRPSGPAAGPAATPNIPITITPENIEWYLQELEAYVWSEEGRKDPQARADLAYLWDRYESYRMQGRLPDEAGAGGTAGGVGGGYSPATYASAARTTALLPGELELQQADITHTQALAREVIETLGGNTYEQQRQRMIDKIDQEGWSRKQALDEFNAWMEGAVEAGRRAETVYGEKMKRAAWTTPTEYYPGTEPGGAREQFGEKYGVPYTSSPGIAVETLPSLDEMYGQWHERMGISERAPPTAGGWSGQGAGQGQNASQAFLSQLRQRYAPQFEAGRA